MLPPVDLSLVAPVYNESEVVASVVEDWVTELDRHGLDYEFHLYDDGSTDDTPAILDRLAGRFPRVAVTHHSNRGHGPTILRGYREAAGRWIMQIDSDNEIHASEFGKLWARREDFDLLIGVRQDRRSTPARRILSLGARMAIRLLFGARASDANSPFRLYRRETFAPLFDSLPDDTFAPNVILTGLTARHRLRLGEVSVAFRGRTTGRASLVRWRVWKAGARALAQTVRAAWRRR